MEDLRNHFFLTVGQLLDQAAIGRLRVTLELHDGDVADGVPAAAGDADGGELDDTGYPRRVKVGGRLVVLDSVRRATIVGPDADPADQE